MVLRALERQEEKKGVRRRPLKSADDPDAEDKYLAQQSHLHLNGLGISRIANLRGLKTLEVWGRWQGRGGGEGFAASGLPRLVAAWQC